jgi:hypothetical protein
MGFPVDVQGLDSHKFAIMVTGVSLLSALVGFEITLGGS